MIIERKVYVVMHNFCSHDMFVPRWAKDGNPTLFGVYPTREEAQKHIRPGADDYIVKKFVEEEE